MAVKFTPTGLLDIATDPSALPAQISGKMEVSGAMVRCKNLTTVDNGIAVTRKGSAVIGTATVGQTTPKLLIEHTGDRYLFSGTVLYKNEASIATVLTAAKWRGVLYNAYNVVTQSLFALNGTDRKRITGSTVAEWGIDAPTVAPTIAGIDYVITYDWESANVTGLTNKFTVTDTVNNLEYVYGWEEFYADDISDHHGVTTDVSYGTFYFDNHPVATVRVTYTYCRKSTNADGDEILECESNPYIPTAVDADGNTDWTELEIVKQSGIKVTWPAATDSQVTHVRIYRTLGDDAVFYYDSEYVVGDLSVVLTALDGGLGSVVETDNDRPPLGSVVVGPVFNGYCFILDDNLLYYSKANKPESWPALQYIEVGPPQFALTAAVFMGGILYVMNRSEIYSVQGTGSASFFPYPANAVTGAISQEGVVAVKGYGIFRVASDGIWLFSGGEDKKFSQERFDPIFRGETVHGIPAVNTTYIDSCWLFQYRNFLYLGYPGDSATEPDSLIVLNLQNMKASYYDYGQTFPCIAVDRTNDRILAADNAGQVWQLETGTEDNGAAISWEIESKAFSDSLQKYFPRYAKYDVEGTATGSILLDNATKQTHSLTGRDTRKRHIAGVTGDRLSIRLSGSGAITIRQVEIE